MRLWSLKFANFHKTFLDQSIWICKWASWWCHRLTTCHIFCTYNFEKFNILRILVIVCPSYQAVLELTLFYIYSERNWGKSNILIAEIWNFLSFLCTKWMGNCEAMTSSTRSFAYSYQLVKKCFLKICETSKCHNILIFQPIFIRFSLFYSQIFTLFYEIKLNLFRISPLTKRRMERRDKWQEKRYFIYR